MKLKNILSFLPVFVIMTLFTSCIEDSFTTSPSDQPDFSCDTLKMGQMFTLEASPTSRFTVYNRHDKMLNISSISLRDDSEGIFRLNVDGISGRNFSNVEIRPNDSIFVYVETTLPENGQTHSVDIESHLDFVTNGVRRTVVILANGTDAVRCRDLTISSDTRWTSDRPYIVYDTLRIAPGATLTLDAGVKIHFHDKAAMKVEGTLISNGTPEANVEMSGDRFGNVAGSLPYELMSGQWGGIYFTSTSTGNTLTCTDIRNSSDGLTFEPAQTDEIVARLYNCRIRNTKNYIIDARHTNLQLVGCELADASTGILNLVGGRQQINHCTIANYYLFTALGGPAIQMSHLNEETDDESGRPYLSADFSNSIIYGNGTELSHGDLTDTQVYFRNCLFKSEGTDDDNFISCLWNADPLYYTVRNEYYFDYRLQPDSPAIGVSDQSLDSYGLTTDRYGVSLANPADLGAYVFVEKE